MIGELSNTFFTQYGKYFSSQQIKKASSIPFKDHPQFGVLIDILSRKDNHHVVLHSEYSHRMHIAFIEALLLNLTHEHIPYPLQDSELIYLDTENLIVNETETSLIEKNFQDLKRLLDFADKNLLLVLNRYDLMNDTFLKKQFARLFNHHKCRFLIFSPRFNFDNLNQPYLAKLFSNLHLTAATETDLFLLLKQQRTELENYHHVLIPDELLSQAYALTERYLSATDILEKTIQLLDSSAARAGAIERMDNNTQFKPVLTTSILINVLSNWTQIPVTHLQINKFKLSEFTQGMHQRVFGQEAAVTALGNALQQANARVQHHTGPFCSLLFAGPEHTGKRTTALALSEQLFKQLHLLYFAALPSKQHSILDLQLQRCTDKRYLTLREIISQTPYAIILLENIHHAAPALLEDIQKILDTGLIHDEGCAYHFHQSILILSTTLGSQRLGILAQSLSPNEDAQPVDLMQLIMNEQKENVLSQHNLYSPQEIIDEILPEISASFPLTACEHLHVIPFIPLNRSAVEQITRLKLKLLGKMLDSRYGIELGYAPEVIRYLANEILAKQDAEKQVIDTDKALKQLYFVIEQAVLSQADNKNRPNQLFMQLNETGQLLRCDWLSMTAVRQHTP